MNRRGIALVMALVAMLLATLLATLVLASARVEWLSGYRQLAARQAFEAAAGAAAWHRARWDSNYVGLVVGRPASLSAPPLPGAVQSFDSIIRLDSGLFLLHSVAVVTDADGGVLARDGVAELIGADLTSGPPDSGLTRVIPRGWWRWP